MLSGVTGGREHPFVGYRGKVAEREQARVLRAGGLTMPEIAQRLGVAKSSVSLWVRDVPFAARPGRTGARRRGPNSLQRRKLAEIEELMEAGKRRIGTLSDREFLVAGLALYAGEGSKRDGCVGFANTDARLIRMFCQWLRKFFDIDEGRLRAALYLHQGLDLEAAVGYWSRLTEIPPTQFLKPYRASPDPTVRSSKHEFGCLTVKYSCSRTHRAVIGLMQALVASADGQTRARQRDPVRPFGTLSPTFRGGAIGSAGHC